MLDKKIPAGRFPSHFSRWHRRGGAMSSSPAGSRSVVSGENPSLWEVKELFLGLGCHPSISRAGRHCVFSRSPMPSPAEGCAGGSQELQGWSGGGAGQSQHPQHPQHPPWEPEQHIVLEPVCRGDTQGSSEWVPRELCGCQNPWPVLGRLISHTSVSWVDCVSF